MITYDTTAKVKFSDEVKEIVNTVILDFNSGKFGHPDITADKLYENYLYFERKRYSLDDLLYHLVMLSLIAKNSSVITIPAYDSNEATIRFIDRETGIVSEYVFPHDPEKKTLIIRTTNKDKLFSFEVVNKNSLALVFWIDEGRVSKGN